MSRILIETWSSLYTCLIRSNQRSLASYVLDLHTRSATSFRQAPCPCLVVLYWWSLSLLLHQCHSSASSRIWALQFPPRSLNMFDHHLFRIGEGLYTALDSSTTTDYPNSLKLIVVISSGMAKGARNTLTSLEIFLSMMTDFVVAPQCIEPYSYVAIADGHKRRNMVKVCAGFSDYDDAAVECWKQQRVPIVLVAECGNPLEADDTKLGNCGKHDSQIVLMASLQNVMFDERVTTFEYEFSAWWVTGVRYELVLCVNADTKIIPDPWLEGQLYGVWRTNHTSLWGNKDCELISPLSTIFPLHD